MQIESEWIYSLCSIYPSRASPIFSWVYCVCKRYFFTAACMVRCFTFITKAVLLARQCFSCHWTVPAQPQSLPQFSSCPPQQLGWGQAGARERTGLGQLTQSDMPCSAMLSSKIWGHLSKGVSSRRSTGHHSAGRWWLLFHHLWFYSFLHFLNCLYLNPGVFSWFCPSNSLPILLQGKVSKQLVGA